MTRTSSLDEVSTKLRRIAKLARESPTMVLTTLAHNIDIEHLREAHRLVRKNGAAGIDGQSAADYGQNLEGNLQELLNRFKTGSYEAPPVRRVHIPKGDGRSTRPIGIPTFEDKILQRAVTMVLEAIYEQDFQDCSYGFRPGRSAHQALEETWKVLMNTGGGWVLEADIESFFESVDHSHLRGFLDQRVRDGVIRRAIDKWLKAGVLEDGALRHRTEGTPQGGVISPILANIYLHEVIDKWFVSEVRPRMRSTAELVRYADDVVMIFASERDALRVKDVLTKRLARYGLRLHPEKTRLLDFRRPHDGNPPRGRSFELLGFCHYWDLSRKRKWVVKRKTAASRLTRAITKVAQWCREHRHLPMQVQHLALQRRVRGHYAYFGITGNVQALRNFVEQVERAWRKWLGRRSGRANRDWDHFKRVLQRYPLPSPRIVHSSLRRVANP